MAPGATIAVVSTARPALLRQLGVVSATALVVSNMIGTGIFTTTGFLAGRSRLAVISVCGSGWWARRAPSSARCATPSWA